MGSPSGLPSNEHGVYTPMGEVEQFGNFVRGMRRTRRHRVLARALLVLVVALFVLPLAVAVLTAVL